MNKWLLLAGTFLLGILASCSQPASLELGAQAEVFSSTLIQNGAFNDGTTGWLSSFAGGAVGTKGVTNNEFCFQISNKGTAYWNIQLAQTVSVKQGKTYRLIVDAYANKPVRLRAMVGRNYGDYGPVGTSYVDFNLTSTKTRYRTNVVINSNEPNARVSFVTGDTLLSSTPATLCIDNIYLGEFTTPILNSPKPYPFGGSLAPSTAVADQIIGDMYARWRASHLVYAPNRGLQPGEIILKSPGKQFNDGMVSEGIGYGMLLAVYNNDKVTFDGIWKFAKRNLNSVGLMPWIYDTSNRVLNVNNATDADLDAAFALIVASKQGWGYDQDAKNLVNAMMQHNVNPGDFALERGEANNPKDIINTSYFAPGYFSVFASFTGDNRWLQVKDANYAYLKNALDQPGVVLAPQEARIDGVVVNDVNTYSSDTARGPWRLATDYVWFGDSRALAMLRDYNTFFESSGAGGISDLCQQYTRFGELLRSRSEEWCGSDAGWVIGGAASAQLAENDTANRSAAWNALTTAYTGDYYSFELVQLGILLTSGKFYNPLQ